MNQAERIRYNLTQKKELEKIRPLRSRAWGYDLAKTFQCIKCGDWVTTENVWFYQGEIDKVKCYKCQEEK